MVSRRFPSGIWRAKYLLEEVSPRLGGRDPGLDDDMMPWSQRYREYERGAARDHADGMVPGSNLPSVGLAFRIKSIAGVSPPSG